MRKVKSYKSDSIPHNKMVMRIVDVKRAEQDPETKSVPVIIATENPVERYEEATGEVYKEILLMDGVEFRGGKNQLPIVDSHDRSTVRNVLGSVRNIRVEDDMLVGDASFARDEDSQIAYQKLLDGHLTDFSITAFPNQQRTIGRGEKEIISGKEISGPAIIVNSWTPSDASLVAAGADETSTVRELLRSYMFNKKGVIRMIDEQIKTMLVAKGMPEQIDDLEQAFAWIIGYFGSLEPVQEVEEVALAEKEEEEEMMKSQEEEMKYQEEEEEKEDEELEEEELRKRKRQASEKEEDMLEEKDEVQKAVKRALLQDQKRRKEIKAICRQAKLPASYADQLCDSGVSINRAREKAIKKMFENKPIGTSGDNIRVVGEGRERLTAAMKDGLISRSLKACGARNRTIENPAKDYEKFEKVSLLRMAEELLRADGVNTLSMSQKDIAMIAMGHKPTIQRLQYNNILRSAYHTTGSFANLLLDAANKTLLRGYDEAPYTWAIWARQAPSVPDFKDINRIRFSESPDLKMVPENDLYPEGKMTDSREKYKVDKFGQVFTITWETVVNDDLDAISRIPQMHGNAARRSQNKLVYQVLTGNPLMGDGQNLFSASHVSGSNLSGATADPAVATLNTSFAAMMRQRGLNSDVIINIQPRYLIVPVALSATALQLVGSLADPLAGGASTTGNSNTLNIYGPNGVRPLQVIVEPQLDGASLTSWYLAADNGQIDTVELTFLQGEEQPVMESDWDFERDVYRFKVRQTFGAAAIDWRGLYKYATT
jgi:hypothetical protein